MNLRTHCGTSPLPYVEPFTFTLSSHVFCISTSLPHYSMSLLSYLFAFFFISFLSFSIFLCQSIIQSIPLPLSLPLYLSSSLSCYTSLFSLTSYSISPPPSHQFISLYQVQILFLTGFLRQSELEQYAPI